MARQSIASAKEQYNLDGWSEGYFGINPQGHLTVHPTSEYEVDVLELIEELRGDGHGPPMVLRFPQILAGRLERINQAFQIALRDQGVTSQYHGVFPIKVNQRKEVVQALARAGRKWQYGLEVGSKAELIAALTMDPNRKSLLIINGFKDPAFLRAACYATTLKDNVIIVIDELGELQLLVSILKETGLRPTLGLRLKLRSKAPGKWALSGGQQAKFGLTISEVLHAVQQLRAAGYLDLLQMVHAHIGSQISDIRRLVQGVRETTRIHAELVKLGVPLQWLDVGGGLAIDYDGTGSSNHNSCNYTIEEYANSLVATVKDVCDEEGVKVPHLITESGRAVVAHHAVLVSNVVRRVPSHPMSAHTARADDPTPLRNLYETRNHLGGNNVFESFHDAVQASDDLHVLFDLGHLRIEALGRGEQLLREVLAKVKDILIRQDETDSEEFVQANTMLRQKMVVNFSLFQSLPDVWGVKQQFPILPIHRLTERPSDQATIADITCDSDGEVRKFIDAHGSASSMPVHALRGESYYLAVPLVGAYQDALGDYHNLFGETNEAVVTVGPDGWHVDRISDGSLVKDMLAWVRYNPRDLGRRLRRRINRLQEQGKLGRADARAAKETLLDLIDGSTYLEGWRSDSDGKPPRDET